MRFAVIGTFGLFVDMAALAVAVNLLDLNLYWGRVVSYLTAATFTWACNRTFTFVRAGSGGVFRQWLTFLAVNTMGGAINFTTYVMVVRRLGPMLPLEPTLAWVIPYLGVALGSISGLCVNFLASKRLVFRH
ncbi:GtrA family protein [Phenylobacterium sp. LH3H17]|uniref:GtrA family protein n=1 Tax=Phenylobacterium sp. LH3H17 TaxID=2903901 RepID=UPI0020C9C97A|nr:GtrA family protein [Phenylobacterium sp. LH3H17]UTP40967.1 GtrA family protein [Phenylobacterium sp. LH3H17]